MAKDEGKKFEEDFYNSLDDLKGIYIHRIRDVQYFKGSTSIGDFLVFKYPNLFVFELKSTKGISISVSKKLNEKGFIKKYGRFNYKQIKQMLDTDVKGVYTGAILNFRKNNNTYYLSAKQIEDYVLNENITRKSIPESWLEKNAIKMKQELKRTRYRYFDDFLKEVVKLGENKEEK